MGLCNNSPGKKDQRGYSERSLSTRNCAVIFFHEKFVKSFNSVYPELAFRGCGTAFDAFETKLGFKTQIAVQRVECIENFPETFSSPSSLYFFPALTAITKYLLLPHVESKRKSSQGMATTVSPSTVKSNLVLSTRVDEGE